MSGYVGKVSTAPSIHAGLPVFASGCTIAMHLTVAVWPQKVCVQRPDSMSQTRTVRSVEPLAIVFPETANAHTPPS